MNESAAFITDFVLPKQKIRQWVLSFPIPLRLWMARNPELMGSILSIVIRAIGGLYKRDALKQGIKDSKVGSITFIQRFGGACNANIHLHIIFIEGVFAETKDEKVVYHKIKSPLTEDVKNVLSTVQKRVVRHLKKSGYLNEEGDIAGQSMADLQDEAQDDLFSICQGASVQNLIGTGENAGQRVRRLGSFGVIGEQPLEEGVRCATLGGFSMHANTSCDGDKIDKIEALIRYVARPPVADGRLYETSDGDIGYRLKKMWNDGTQAVLFTPLEFIEKLVALIPLPKRHQVRYHGALAPNSSFRSRIVPSVPKQNQTDEAKLADPRRMTWAQMLKRTFQVDLTVCPDCGGKVRFIQAVMKRNVVQKILTHLGLSTEVARFHPAQGSTEVQLSFV